MDEIVGRIVKIKDNELIVLTTKGEFFAVEKPKASVKVGDEISGCPKIKKKSFNIAFVFSAAIFLLAFMFSFSFSANSQPLAYVTIDINPSIELTLGKEGKILEIRPLNEDGKKILDSLSRKENLKADNLIKEIIRKAVEMGFITAENSTEVLISVTPAKESLDEDTSVKAEEVISNIENELESAVQQAIRENEVTAEVETVLANGKDRTEAEQLGLSTGKYIFMQKAKELGYNITPEQLQSKSISHVIKEDLGIEVPGQFIRQVAKINHGQAAPAQSNKKAEMDSKVKKQEETGHKNKEKTEIIKEQNGKNRKEREMDESDFKDGLNNGENPINNEADNVTGENVKKDIVKEKQYKDKEKNSKKDTDYKEMNGQEENSKHDVVPDR